MTDFKIISDSSCDLPVETLEKYDISLVPYMATFNGVDYYKEGVDIALEEFYEKLRQKGVFPKTSLPPIQDYVDIFRPYLEKGIDVLCVCLTSKFSGSYQSATNAANMLLEEFPERQIKVIDSYLVTYLQGLLVMDIAEYKAEGKTMDEISDIVDTYKKDSYIFVTVDSLSHLQNGGRIGKATALAGSLLNIKPIISYEDGELNAHSKVRGRKKALHEIVNISEGILKGKADEYRIVALHNGYEEDAKELVTCMAERNLTVSSIQKVGITISVHIGPTAAAIIFLRNRPKV
ncbi:DegV family protein [Tyzzerella sp. OttesenSCG-928-J15]|nr:DegV family protein [Tyzzerella sp. OttesenSCG-928-J15]